MEISLIQSERGTITMESSPLEIPIPVAYHAFKIIPHPAEVDDTRIPKDIGETLSLFLKTNNQECAQRLIDNMDRLLAVLANGPDGKTEIKIGRGICCWNCGHVGIPSNNEALIEDHQNNDGKGTVRAVCSACKTCEDNNFVEGLQPDGSFIPFIEAVEKNIAGFFN